MNQQERLAKILTYLDYHQTMDIQKMMETFRISRDTARRDIVKLAEKNLVVRTHGGVSSTSFQEKIENYTNRSILQLKEKQVIGKKAASIITSGELVYLDVSTTVNFISPYLREKKITVVTNSIDCAYELALSEEAIIHFLGGILNKNSRHVSGHSTLNKIKDFHFDKVFIGATGITKDGVYNGFEEDIYLKRELMKHADQVVLVADHTKINKRQHYKVLDLEHIDTFISDRPLPLDLSNTLEEVGVEIIITTD